jgi:hypothetical protein
LPVEHPVGDGRRALYLVQAGDGVIPNGQQHVAKAGAAQQAPGALGELKQAGRLHGAFGVKVQHTLECL